MAKPHTYYLEIIPPPRGKFGPEQARKWLHEMLPQYMRIMGTALEGRRREVFEADSYYILGNDIDTMAQACAEVTGGGGVRFERSHEEETGEALALAVLAYQVLDEDRVMNTGEACAALALECRARLKLLQGKWDKRLTRTIEFTRKQRLDELEETQHHAERILKRVEEFAERLGEYERSCLTRLTSRLEEERVRLGWPERQAEGASDAP